MAWSPQGDLIATGSNDKTVKLMRYNDDQKQLEGREVKLKVCSKYCPVKKYFSYKTLHSWVRILKVKEFRASIPIIFFSIRSN